MFPSSTQRKCWMFGNEEKVIENKLEKKNGDENKKGLLKLKMG